jgi:hypothetical protein
MCPGKRPFGRVLRIIAVGTSSLITCVVLHGLAGAQTATIANRNSTITFDLGSSAGMNSWTVNGFNQLNQQWFWFGIGSGPLLDVSQISAPIYSAIGNTISVAYSNSQYEVDLDYTLLGFGTGSGKSSLTEQVNFVNHTASAIDLHFFMYSDFTLGGAAYANSQNVTLGYVTSLGTTNTTSLQTVSAIRATNSIAINMPAANRLEVAGGSQLYNELTTSNGWTLNNFTTGGPGHETWAMEWDQTVNAGDTFGTLSISDTMQVPEPSLYLIGAVGVWITVFCARNAKKALKVLD